MKKILMLTAAGLMFQAAPALADDHKGGHMKKDGSKIEEMFKSTDVNGDGAISKDEYLAHIQKKASEKFDSKDTNNDGSISQDEAKAYHESKRSKMKEKMSERRDMMKEKRMEKREAAE